MKKILLSEIRDLLNDVKIEKISFSRMCELINEKAGNVEVLPANAGPQLIERGFISVDVSLPEPEVFVEAAYLVGSMSPHFKIHPSFLRSDGRDRFRGEADWVRVKYWRYPPDMNKK